MLDKNILESFESIKSKYSLDEADLDNATRMERNQIEGLKVTIKNKKDELLKKAAQNALKEQEEFFKYKVIPTEEAALKFIEQYAKAFLNSYKSGKLELVDSILYKSKSSPAFISFSDTYPTNMRWLLEYVSSINNGLVGNSPGTFISEKLPTLLKKHGIRKVIVERSWSSQYQEWCEPDQGSYFDGGYITVNAHFYEVLLLSLGEFETLSKFDKSKKYELLDNSALKK